MNLDQFIEKYKGKGVDYDHFYFTQCVDLVRQYIKEVLNQPQPRGVVGAKDFWTNYESDPNLNQYFNKIPNTPEGIPSKGDIIVWGSTYGKFGHIAIINWANVNQFQALSQNDPSGSLTVLKNYNYTHILGWFNPKGNNMADMYNGYDLANRESMKVAVDVLVRVQKGEFVEKSKLDELVNVKTAELSSKISNYEEENKGLRIQIQLLNKEKQDQAVQIKSLHEDITKLNNELENCTSEIPGQEDLESNYEITGKKIISRVGDTTVETTYKVKE
jgi:hypothetical protein